MVDYNGSHPLRAFTKNDGAVQNYMAENHAVH